VAQAWRIAFGISTKNQLPSSSNSKTGLCESKRLVESFLDDLPSMKQLGRLQGHFSSPIRTILTRPNRLFDREAQGLIYWSGYDMKRRHDHDETETDIQETDLKNLTNVCMFRDDTFQVFKLP
jgi:hypothetical protein